jgi:hypothetical protein
MVAAASVTAAAPLSIGDITMSTVHASARIISGCLAVLSVLLSFAQTARAETPPSYTPEQLDKLVDRIDLYPDPLLAQVLTASTYYGEIREAAKWADEHHYLSGSELGQAIADDKPTWDPSIQALLPFPSVLDVMAADMTWTTDLGTAVLAERGSVMDAVQHERELARRYGYLRSAGPVVVSGTSYVEILPANPDFIVVPYYDPLVVFVPPRPGIVVDTAIGFGFGITIGAWAHPWGWGTVRIAWPERAVYINNVRWERTWVNRTEYVHPYPEVHRYDAVAREERHEQIRRSEAEREDARHGRPPHEEHERRGHR